MLLLKIFTCQHRSPKDARPSPPLSLGAQCRRDGTSPRSKGRGPGKKGPRNTWQSPVLLGSAGRSRAGWLRLPFPPAGCWDALPPLNRCRARGDAPLARSWVGGGVTEDPRPSWNTVANIPYPGHPRHGVRRGLEPRARKGRWRAAPGPKGQQNGTGERSPRTAALSPPDPPPSPTLGHLSGHRPPPPKTAIFGHAHRHHSGLLMSQATSLPSVPGPINTGTPAPGPQFAELRGVLSCQHGWYKEAT